MTARTKPSAYSEALTLFSGSATSEAIEQVPRGDDESRHPDPDPEATGSPSRARKMSLLEIDECLCLLMDSAVEAASENDGEIPAELQQALLDYCEAFGEKVDNIARYIRSQEFEAANASTEIDRLKQRKTAAENRCERLKALLKFFMQSRNL